MNHVEIIYPEFFVASLTVIPVLLLGSFLNEKFIERTQFAKNTKLIYKAIIVSSIVAMTLSLINLLPIAGLQTSMEWKFLSFVLNFLAFFICACGVGILGFMRIEEVPTGELDHRGTTELEAETKQDKKKTLDNSTKRSVATPEGSQRRTIDTPKEEGKKLQGEPSPTGVAEERINPEESTEDPKKL